MKYTNKSNLPQYLVDWLLNDGYDHDPTENVISATSLMKPVRASVLTKRHIDNLEQDVSDLVASRMGSAIHDSIERVETPGIIKEQRVKRKLTIKGVEFTVTGKFDVLQENKDGTYTLRDIKTTSVWAKIYSGKDEDYSTQLSIYRWLLSPEKKVNPVAQIDFFFTDWSSSKAKTEENYPQSRLGPGHIIQLKSLQETEKFITDRLTEFLEGNQLEDEDLPFCSDEELWASQDKFAVYKIGNKKATKLFENEQEAKQFAAAMKEKSEVQYRPGKVKRCNYCSARPFCNQYQMLKERNLIEYF